MTTETVISETLTKTQTQVETRTRTVAHRDDRETMRQRMQSLATMGQYSVVVIDPPWTTNAAASQKHKSAVEEHQTEHGRVLRTGGSLYDGGRYYDVMSLDEIRDLPVPAVLADDAFVFVWTINRFLPHTFELLTHWGLQYIFTMTWHKTAGAHPTGYPYYNAEWAVVGRKGNPKFTTTKQFFTTNTWPRREHSEKPEEFYDLLRRVTVAPRLDVFGRRVIQGFSSWGNEAPVPLFMGIDGILDPWETIPDDGWVWDYAESAPDPSVLWTPESLMLPQAS